jgi:tetratricopeptide (TPR) repeat protein
MKQAKNTSFESSQYNEVAKKLKADSYIIGSFQNIKNKTLIVVNLINTNSSEVLLTRSVEGNIDSAYKDMTDSLSRQIKNFLEIKVLEQNANPDNQEAFTNSAEAYRKYIEGMNSIVKGDYQIAAKTLKEAYRIDSTFTLAVFFCAFAYCNYDSYQAGGWVQKAYVGKGKLPVDYQMWLEMWHAGFITKDPKDLEIYANSIEKSDTKSRYILFDVGVAITILEKYDKSVNMFEKAAEVSSEWGEPWKFRDYYTLFADACHKAGKPDKEIMVLKTGLKLFPDDIKLKWRQARLALSNGNTKRAKEIISEYEYLCKRYGVSKSELKANLGSLYDEADSLNRAEEYYRQALALEPENALRLNSLASFLINKDRNINEGLKFVEKALELKPDNCDIIDTKGWGLFKQGKYEEALKLLEKSWDLSPSLDWIYIYIHLQEVKKAIASEK